MVIEPPERGDRVGPTMRPTSGGGNSGRICLGADLPVRDVVCYGMSKATGATRMTETPITGPSWPPLAPSGRLKGRRIVVTGAGSGIGRRTAEMFSQEGAAVALLDRDTDGLRETESRSGGSVHAVDVTQESSVAAAVAQAAEAMGGIDGVVNAAGILLGGAVEDVDAAAWRRVIDVNLTGTYIVVRACLPHLRAAPAGTIVNIASGVGLLPTGPNMTAYAASKGGVVTLTRALAMECAPKIRVNSVCPGAVDTPMIASSNARRADLYALKRWADPREIAQAIMFLTSTESAFVTGIALPVDGGRTFH
jgi:NAD(P)-dependent dehydrogenase (short-subunit alcohol dehydrogenase family)